MTKRNKLLGALFAVSALAATSAVAQDYDNTAEFESQLELLSLAPEGSPDAPWVQSVKTNLIETSAFEKDGDRTICFSNAGVNNPWRVVGWTNMQAEVALHSNIKEFIVTDAEGSDDKQIADIDDLLAGGKCDILIVSPNTSAALTPAVEKACEQLPVIVFDRGVNTDCPVTFIKPIGGYAFGIQSATFIAENVGPDAKVLALRILPGVDVLETRFSAAKRIFAAKNVEIIGVEFTGADRAKTKGIVEDYLAKEGFIDAIWMDAGATAVAAVEAYEDSGYDYPVINGEDQQDFLVKWKNSGMKAIAPTYPTFQWRTPIIAALRILDGESIPGPKWSLPQPAITEANLDEFINPSMPALHYAMCGCEELPDYPAAWGGK